MTLFFIVRCNTGWFFAVWGLSSSLYSFIERWKLQLVLFLLRTDVTSCSRWTFFFSPSLQPPAPDKHGGTLVLVKLINRCIFYVAVASALMLCDRPRQWEFCVLSLVSTPSRSGRRHGGPSAWRLAPVEFKLWSNLTLTNQKPCVFSFFCFFFFPFFFFFFEIPFSDWHHPRPPPPPSPNPPKPYEGGEEVCSVCQRRANVSAITSSPSPPRVRGGCLAGGRCSTARHTVGLSYISLSLLIIVWWPTVVLKDVSLSIKKDKYKIFFFIPSLSSSIFPAVESKLSTKDAFLAFQVKTWFSLLWLWEQSASHRTLLILPATKNRGCCG